jgi:hypothetical protein
MTAGHWRSILRRSRSGKCCRTFGTPDRSHRGAQPMDAAKIEQVRPDHHSEEPLAANAPVRHLRGLLFKFDWAYCSRAPSRRRRWSRSPWRACSMMYFASLSRTALDSRSDSNVLPRARSDCQALSNAAAAALLPRIYDVCSCSGLEGSSKVTFQISWAYSPTVRSEENHAIRAMLSMLVRVQSNVDRHSLSTLLWVAK